MRLPTTSTKEELHAFGPKPWYLWGGLFGLLWFICLVSAGVLTWKNGHKILFFVGFLLPLLWIVGAVMSKKPAPYKPGIGR